MVLLSPSNCINDMLTLSALDVNDGPSLSNSPDVNNGPACEDVDEGPIVVDNIIPREKQTFGSIDEAYQFYNAYAKKVGFSARIGSSKKNRGTAEIVWKQFVCSKQGVGADILVSTQERNRGLTRTGCKAQLSIVKRQGATIWQASQFIEEHNHVLATPRKTHLLRSHRKVSNAKKALAKQLNEANVPTHQQLRILEIQSGGIENVGCIEQDYRNHGRDLKEEAKGYDADTLFEYFSSQKEKNPSFYFEFDKDGEDRMTRCYWADPKAIRAYTYFGDVVIF